jgi:hypothetical protein
MTLTHIAYCSCFSFSIFKKGQENLKTCPKIIGYEFLKYNIKKL